MCRAKRRKESIENVVDGRLNVKNISDRGIYIFHKYFLPQSTAKRAVKQAKTLLVFTENSHISEDTLPKQEITTGSSSPATFEALPSPVPGAGVPGVDNL